MSNRKDDHISLALNQKFINNDFDHVRFVPESLCYTDCSSVDISVNFFDRKLLSPIYINAMSGGSLKSLEVNKKLARLSKACGFPIATGSVSAAIKNKKWKNSFSIVREINRDGLIFANIGITKNFNNVLKAIDILKADAIQIHLNAAQEIIMPEGDRFFSFSKEKIKEITSKIKIPVIVKEVGFGMSKESVSMLYDLGVRNIDISGKGGTNFIKIENHRRETRLESFENNGFSTVESLLDLKNINKKQLNIFASGGIRDAYDIVKALALGAKLVGMSGYFLKLVEENSLEEAIKKAKNLIEDVKNIMAVLNAKSIEELKSKKLIFNQKLLNFINQRKNSH